MQLLQGVVNRCYVRAPYVPQHPFVFRTIAQFYFLTIWKAKADLSPAEKLKKVALFLTETSGEVRLSRCWVVKSQETDIKMQPLQK